jgi:hypothetical protein
MNRTRNTLLVFSVVAFLAAMALAQAPQQPAVQGPPPGFRPAPVPPKPISDEYLLLGDETRGSGEAQFTFDPTNPNIIVASGMGTWQIIPGCEAPNVNCKDFHNFPHSTLPVSAITYDGGRTWKHFILPILDGAFTRCPDEFAASTKDGILIMGCEPRETDPVKIDPFGEAAIVVSYDHGKTWSKRVDGINSYNKPPYPIFDKSLKPRFGGNSPWDRPWIYVDDSTGTIYMFNSGGETDIDTGTPGKYRTQSYFTVSRNKAKSFGTIYAVDAPDWPQVTRASFAAGLGSVAEMYVASKVPASEAATCPCQVFGISYDEGKTWQRHVMKEIQVPAAATQRGGGGPDGGGILGNLIADPTTKGRFSAFRYVGGQSPHYEVATTNDDGKTWSEFVSTPTVPNSMRYIKPAWRYSRDGVLGIVWKAVYPGDESFELWSAISKDAGKTFSNALKISHGRSLPRQYYRQSMNDDNDGVDMSKDDLFAIWGDSRAGFQGSWFGKVSLSSYQFGGQ